MSMTSPQGEQTCEICGREFPSVEEAADHLANEHGGPSGREPGGTTGLEPKYGSGPTGTTTSGSRPQTDEAYDTVEGTEGGAHRVQTE
jgi:hypothetical protein